MDELKPCPFCGKAGMETYQRLESMLKAHEANLYGCVHCGIYTVTVAAWNALPRNPAPPAQGSIVEALAELREAGGKAWDGVADVEAEHRARWPEPPTLVWSSEPPKVVGLYACRLKGERNPEDYEYNWNDEDDIARGARGYYVAYEFAGPFPEPKEAAK